MARTSNFLRRVLLVDGTSCIASGLLAVFGSRALGQLLGLPDNLLLYAGLSLFPFAAFLIYVAMSKVLTRMSVGTAIVLNVLWTVDSVLILLTGWVSPTELGYAFVVVQALGVAILASLEYVGWRRSEMRAL
jgi:hypothetical protein